MELESDKALEVIEGDPYLQDVIERNFEVAAQSCIYIANRIISLANLQKPADYYEAIERIGQADILPDKFARDLAPLAGFRNLLVHQYLDIDQKEVYSYLENLDQLYQFEKYIREWLSGQVNS